MDVGERARVLAELAGRRSLAEVLDGGAAVVDALPVRELLEALPWVDAIHAGQLMRELGMAERRTVGGLSERQRGRLRELFGSAAAA
ncbi:integration host factor [Streptacidiphilus sp. MAP12-16]|uniref:integration host factor n=1 Tax=Streptacidiphilus sp. MAP12-16 TaxID=3156300 RepID=UPI0035179076